MNVTRYRGDTYPQETTVFKSSDRTPADLTGSILTWSVSPERRPSAANYIFQITGTLVDAPNGVVEYRFTESAADNVGTFFYDIELVSAGKTRTIDYGSITFIQDITKNPITLIDEFSNPIVDEFGNNIVG